MRDNPKAVLLDFDGTLVDTEPLWTLTEQGMLAERGLTFDDETLASMRGQSAWITASMLAEAYGEPESELAVYEDLHARIAAHISSHDLPWLPGAQQLVAELAGLDIPCAIVTASNRQIIDAAVQRLPRNVRFIVTSDDVANTKPHPEPYLKAAAKLGVDPVATIALEDSIPGVTSALATGAVVYAVGTAELPSHARMFRSPTSLETTTWEELTGIWQQLKDRR